MKKIAIIIIFVFNVTYNLFAQYDTVKMQIAFKSLIYNNSMGPVSSSLDSFQVFLNSPITINELVSNGFNTALYFFKISKLDSQLIIHKSIFSTNCPTPYVIAFNINTNTAYRIMGFDTNDLLQIIPAKVKLKKLDDDYYIEDVNIKCIYEGLTSKRPINLKKYPCLRGCGWDQALID